MIVIGLEIQLVCFLWLLLTTDIRTSLCFLGTMLIIDLLYLLTDWVVKKYQEKSDFITI